MRIVIVIGALVALGLLAVLRPVRAPAIPATTSSARLDADGGPSLPPRPQPSAPATLVYVAGEVVHPGVYAVAADARVSDAVTRAGGLRPGADPTAVNLAAHVRDGDEILVAARGTVAPSAARRHRAHSLRRRSHGRARDGSSRAGESAPSAAVDLNAADAATLATVPGIGPGLAERIVAFRTANGPFASADGLLDVAGITDRRLESALPYVVVH
jgi:competence protein ComEA